MFSAARSAYPISQITGGFQIAGPDGTDQLFNIENAAFSDQTILLGSSTPPQTQQTHWMASVDLGPHPRRVRDPNVTGVIITSNDKIDGIYPPAEDRRHLVVWSDMDKSAFPGRLLESPLGLVCAQ